MNNRVFFKYHPEIEIPRELIELGFKDQSYANDEIPVAVKGEIGVWIRENIGDLDSKFTVSHYIKGEWHGEIGDAETIENLLDILNKTEVKRRM